MADRDFGAPAPGAAAPGAAARVPGGAPAPGPPDGAGPRLGNREPAAEPARTGAKGLGTRTRGAAGGSIVLLGGIVVTAGLNYALGVALAWLLPPEEFGVVGLLLNLLLLATSVLAAGFPWALARAVAQADAEAAEGATGRSARDSAAATFRAAILGNVGLGALLGIAFAAVQLTTGTILPGVGAGPTLVAAATIVLLALGSALIGGLQGAKRFDAIGLTRVLEIAVKVVLTLLLVAVVGMGVGGAAVALLASAAVAAGWACWALRDRLPGWGPIAGTRAFAAAVPMSVATTCVGAMGTLDILLLGSLGRAHGVTAAIVGFYQAAAILARAPLFASQAISDAVFPFIAGAKSQAEAHRWMVVALRWVPLAIVPLQLVLLIIPDTVLGAILPSDYGDAGDLVRVLTIGATGIIVTDMLLKALFARGFAAVVAARLPFAVAVQVAALVTLVPRFGAVGAAWAFAAGAWTAVLLLALAYRPRFRPGRLRVPTVARWLVAVAVLAALLLVAGRLPTLPAIAVAIAALLVYAGVAVLVRLVPESDLARVRRLLPGRRVTPAPHGSDLNSTDPSSTESSGSDSNSSDSNSSDSDSTDGKAARPAVTRREERGG